MMAPAMAERRRGRRKEGRRKGLSERRKERRGEQGGEESESGRRARLGRRRAAALCWTTIALFITPEVAEFTIKIPRSAALMDRRARNSRRRLWYFQMNPPLFPPRDVSARGAESLRNGGGSQPSPPPPGPSRSPPDDIDEFCRRGGICLGDSISICRRFFGRSFDQSVAERDARSGGMCVCLLCVDAA